MRPSLSLSLKLPSQKELKEAKDQKQKALYLDFLNNTVQNEVKKTLHDFQHTPAILALSQLTNEFLMNALDAEASEILLEMNLENDQIHCVFKDNGRGIDPEKTGKYEWRDAILTKSDKEPTAGLFGGKNLGLAICAHFLETEGNGTLSLSNRTDGNHGAVITLTSDLKKLIDFDILDEGLNYKRMMLIQQLNDPILDEKKRREAKEILTQNPLKPGERETRNRFSSSPILFRDNSSMSVSEAVTSEMNSSASTSPNWSRDNSNTSESVPPANTAKKRKPPSLFSGIVDSSKNVLNPTSFSSDCAI